MTALCGAIAFAEPLEDLWRGGRNALHQRPADGRTVVVGIDDATIDALSLDYSERHDAAVIENLLAAGARHIYFDRTYQHVMDPAGSDTLLATLRRHSGRVSLGIAHVADLTKQGGFSSGPHQRYRPYIVPTSLRGYVTPFALSSELDYGDTFEGRKVPSISSHIVGLSPLPEGRYRPDWRILASTVPTFSFLDVERGKLPAGAVRGKDVLVGPTSDRIPDIFKVVGQGWTPGVYFHALGAQTLREGHPSKPSWLYPFSLGFAMAVLALVLRNRKALGLLHGGAGLMMLVVPFVTDRLFMTVDYLPTFLLYVVVAVRGHTLNAVDAAEEHNAESQLPNLRAFRKMAEKDFAPIAALAIRNYQPILAAYPDIQASSLLDAVARPVRLSGVRGDVYHEGNTLYWQAPVMGENELAAHLEGLTRLLSSVRIGDTLVDLDLAIGVDMRVSEPVSQRIHAAENAAARAALDGRVYRFSPGDGAQDERWRLSLMSELDRAIDEGVLDVAYQPQIDLAGGRVVAAEALARWNHPVRGAIAPTEFIAAAEAANRIERLTYYVLDRALADTARMIEIQPDFEIGVNLSTRMLGIEGLPARVAQILARHHVPATQLRLEITETASMQDAARDMANLDELAALGVSISIDDYGTGNATLEYLRAIPVSEIKIDRQFVTGLAASSRDQLLIKSTIALSHALGHMVTAEGVEDADSLALLRNLRCDRAQGYYIARPAPLEKLAEILMRQHDVENGKKSSLAFG